MAAELKERDRLLAAIPNRVSRGKAAALVVLVTTAKMCLFIKTFHAHT